MQFILRYFDRTKKRISEDWLRLISVSEILQRAEEGIQPGGLKTLPKEGNHAALQTTRSVWANAVPFGAQ